MSFGFLTESALLPSKSKPILVDSRSLVDLKAVVYEKEQKVKFGGGESSSGGLRALRGKRAKSGDAGGSTRKDPFAKRNRGVEDRSQRDELERVTESSKKKAAERRLAAKSSLYEKMAKGEVDSSRAESLVDFSRKTGSDLALLEAKAEKRGRGQGGRGRRRGGGTNSDGDDDYDALDTYGAEITIVDEFGRDRSVARGGAEHRAYLEAKKAAAESEMKEQAESKLYDERYSYRGNKGAAALPAGGAVAGQWAWSSGAGRGADEGDFETREGEEHRANKKMKKLLEKEGGDEEAKDGGAKILSQWEKTLTGDQKSFLREVHEETEANRNKTHTDRNKQRAERKELLRRKQEEARAARSRRDA